MKTTLLLLLTAVAFANEQAKEKLPDLHPVSTEWIQKQTSPLFEGPCANPDTAKPRQALQAQAPCVDCERAAIAKTTGLTAFANQVKALKRLLAETPAEHDARELAYLKSNLTDATRYITQDPGLDNTAAVLAEAQAERKKLESDIVNYREANTAIGAAGPALNGLKQGGEVSPANRLLIRHALNHYISFLEKNLLQIPKGTPSPKTDTSSKSASTGGFGFGPGIIEQVKAALKTAEELKKWTLTSEPLPKIADMGFFVSILKNVQDTNATQIKEIIDDRLPLSAKRIEQLERRLTELEALKKSGIDLTPLQKMEERYIGTMGGKLICGLSVAEAVALVSYSDSSYGILNPALRSGTDNAEVIAHEKTLKAALAKLAPYTGIVNRGATLPPDLLDQHRVGEVVTYPGFTSTSIGNGFNQVHRLMILSKDGRFIGSVSNHKGENEVLFKSGTKFRVLNREEVDGRTHIIMEEVE